MVRAVVRVVIVARLKAVTVLRMAVVKLPRVVVVVVVVTMVRVA